MLKRRSGSLSGCHTIRSSSEAGGLQDLLVLGGQLHLLQLRLPGALAGHLLLVEGLALHLTLALQALDQLGVLPAELAGQVAELAEAALRAQAQHLQGLRDDNTLLAVVRVRDALEAL